MEMETPKLKKKNSNFNKMLLHSHQVVFLEFGYWSSLQKCKGNTFSVYKTHHQIWKMVAPPSLGLYVIVLLVIVCWTNVGRVNRYFWINSDAHQNGAHQNDAHQNDSDIHGYCWLKQGKQSSSLLLHSTNTTDTFSLSCVLVKLWKEATLLRRREVVLEALFRSSCVRCIVGVSCNGSFFSEGRPWYSTNREYELQSSMLSVERCVSWYSAKLKLSPMLLTYF